MAVARQATGVLGQAPVYSPRPRSDRTSSFVKISGLLFGRPRVACICYVLGCHVFGGIPFLSHLSFSACAAHRKTNEWPARNEPIRGASSRQSKQRTGEPRHSHKGPESKVHNTLVKLIPKPFIVFLGERRSTAAVCTPRPKRTDGRNVERAGR